MGPSEVQALILGQWMNIVGKDHDDDDDRGKHKDKHKHDKDREGWGQPASWWQQQPAWWQQQHPWYPKMPWQAQQPWQQPSPYGQYPYGQPSPYGQPRPDDRVPYRPGFMWVPQQGQVPGHWVRQQGQPGQQPVVREHRSAGVGAEWYSVIGAQPVEVIPPRNALVQDRGPERAGREVLPMSTGVAILPTQSAQITARPQRVAFRPERVFISAAGTSGGAADWVVNDIKIGNRSQFSQSGDVPGDMFATNAIDGFVSFETAQTAMDVVMVVTYIGLNESGVPFFASIVGTAAI